MEAVSPSLETAAVEMSSQIHRGTWHFGSIRHINNHDQEDISVYGESDFLVS